MAEYMHYHGRAVEVYTRTPKGKAIPRLHPGDRGEAVGDYAVLDDTPVEWDGHAWVPSRWQDFALGPASHHESTAAPMARARRQFATDAD